MAKWIIFSRTMNRQETTSVFPSQTDANNAIARLRRSRQGASAQYKGQAVPAQDNLVAIEAE